MYGLDLFSGIGGITKALEGYVEPVAYCENERYAQAVLLSRMATGDIPLAPIWDDVKTLRGTMLPPVEIIYGGFPCQDISVAGRGAGLEGKRSGLFFEIMRLTDEIRPIFILLENVPAIRKRGGSVVVGELARRGYDCRWITLSAADIGANHKRERWWLLAHAGHGSGRNIGTSEIWQDSSPKRPADHDASSGSSEQSKVMANTACGENIQRKSGSVDQAKEGWEGGYTASGNGGEDVSHSHRPRCQEQWSAQPNGTKYETVKCGSWWELEPNVGRVAHGVPFRVDRLRGLGNSVVPAQAREAFERLMGLK